MTDQDAGGPAQGNGAEPLPGQEPVNIQVVAQFVRDFSFENPRAPDSLRPGENQPQIDLGVEMNARGREDGLFEVDLKLSAKAMREDGPMFVVEILYGGLFRIEGVPAEHIEPVLLIECPRFLFPFARRMIADVTSDGGYPPFLLDPIDFAGVYAQRRAEADAAGGGVVMGNA
jgi:preprotein translocase subunit SecB